MCKKEIFMLEYVSNQRAEASKTNAFIETRKVQEERWWTTLCVIRLKKKGGRNEHLTVMENLPKKICSMHL